MEERKWKDHIAKQKLDEVELKKQTVERERKKESRAITEASPWTARVREACKCILPVENAAYLLHASRQVLSVVH